MYLVKYSNHFGIFATSLTYLHDFLTKTLISIEYSHNIVANIANGSNNTKVNTTIMLYSTFFISHPPFSRTLNLYAQALLHQVLYY